MSVSAISNPPIHRAIRLHRSARMETLLDVLVTQLARTPDDLDESLRGEVIAVPNRGMGRWLSMSLAQRVGICAGVQLPFPRKMLQQALREVLGEEGCPHPGWESNALAWHVLAALDSLIERPEFSPIRSYLESTGASDELLDRQRLLLARRISVTFDRYITQRPLLARQWSEGDAGEDTDWQPILWHAVQESIGGPHLAACAHQLQQNSHRSRVLERVLPGRLHLFGVTSIPPLFLEILRALTNWWEIHLHVLTPSEVYWAELQTRLEELKEVRAQIVEKSFDAGTLESVDNPFKIRGNALLENYGALSRDMQLMLEGSSAETPYVEAMTVALPETPTTLLETLQHDIHHYVDRGTSGEEGTEPPILVDSTDRTVQVHACHGPTRQVEVLRDVLLGLLNDDPTLEPRDIVVMTPDIEAHAPLLEAVFSDGNEGRVDPVSGERTHGEEGFPRLPHSIADRSLARENRSAEAVLALLVLASGPLKASGVLDFLALEPVRRRFGIADIAEETLRTWVRESGIRWGLDAHHRARRGQPEEGTFTWRFGLDRLLLGVAMDEGPTRSFGGVVPWDSAAVGERELLAKFIEFTESFMTSVDELTRPQDAESWRSAIGRAMDRLLVTNDDSVDSQQQVRTALDELVVHVESVEMKRAFSPDAMESVLRERIELQAGPSGFLGGRITCCAMVPMRSIPFRVVCLLGMDDGAFPRQGGRLGFDRVAESPRLGDTDPRKEDRHLFLEALLSARDHLVVVHTGRSRKDNKPREPAVPVCDLLDVLERSVRLRDAPERSIREHLVQHHPLHAFSEANYGVPPFSFDARGIVGAEQLRSPREESPAFVTGPLPGVLRVESESASTLEIEQLIRFLVNPARDMVHNRLQVSLGVRQDDLPDREPFELNALERFGLGERLLGASSLTALKDMLRGEGLLPIGAPGEFAYAQVERESRMIRERMERLGGGPSESRDIDCVLGGVRLVGTIPGVCPDALVQGRFGSDRAEDCLRLWMHQALLTLQDPVSSLDAFFVGRPDKNRKATQISIPATSEDSAARQERLLQQMGGLITLYQEGQTSLLPFHLESARAYHQVFKKKRVDPDDPPADLLVKAIKAAQKPLQGYMNEGMEVHVQRVHGPAWVLEPETRSPGAGSESPSFHELARQIWVPVMEACNDNV